MWKFALWIGVLCSMTGCDDILFGIPRDGVKVYEADWAGMTELMEDECVKCHTGGSTPPNLPEDVEEDIRSGTGAYVVPGDPSASLFWRLLSGSVGPEDPAVMPLGTGPLPNPQHEAVSTWISTGASIGEEPEEDTGSDSGGER